MNLKSIEYFLTTVEEMNFTRAAERLFISQQALSSHIKRLEDEYNVQLFERKPSLHLTLEGEQMVFYGKQFLNTEANMRAAFSDINNNCRGTLRVGISRLRGNTFFPSIWKYYHNSHPNISIELVDGNSDTLDDLLHTGKIDLYIGIDVPPTPNRTRIELAHEKIQCCFSESLLKAYYPDCWQTMLCDFEKGVDLTRLSHLPFITLREGNRLRKGIDQFFSSHFLPQYIFECDQQELVYELAKSGAGAGLLSPVIFYQHIMNNHTTEDPFYVFPVNNEIPENTMYLVYRNDYPLPRYTLDFIHHACIVSKNYTRSMNQHFRTHK